MRGRERTRPFLKDLSFTDDISASIAPSPIVSPVSPLRRRTIDSISSRKKPCEESHATPLKSASLSSIQLISKSTPKDFWDVYACTFLCALSIHVWQPMLPYLLEEISAGKAEYGNLMSLTSFVYMVGAFLAGPLIDRYGPRKMLVVSFLASGMSSFLAFTSSSIASLYISRLPLVLHQVVLASRALVSLQSQSNITLLSYISLSYGFGTTAGPVLSSALVRITNTTASTAIASTLFSIVGFFLAFAFHSNEVVPESGADYGRVDLLAAFGIHDMLRVARIGKVWTLLVVKLLVSLSSSTVHASLSYILSQDFGLQPTEIGWIYSSMGVVVVVSQLIFNRSAASRASHEIVLVYSASTMSTSMLLMAINITRIPYFGLGLCAFVSAGTIFISVHVAALTRAVSSVEQGTVVGLDMGISNATRVLGPLLSTHLNNSVLAASLITGIAAIIQQQLGRT